MRPLKEGHMAAEKRRSKLILSDADPAVQPQSLAIYTLDAAGKVLSTAAVGENGEFDLSAEAAARRRASSWHAPPGAKKNPTSPMPCRFTRTKWPSG
jgi:hypothetical protein